MVPMKERPLNITANTSLPVKGNENKSKQVVQGENSRGLGKTRRINKTTLETARSMVDGKQKTIVTGGRGKDGLRYFFGIFIVFALY